MAKTAFRDRDRVDRDHFAMGDLIYVVSESQVEIMPELAGGAEELLWVAEPGDYFGELGPLFHMPRSATARARTDATVCGFTVAAFRERLGVGAIRDLIAHRPLDMDGDFTQEPD